MVGLRGTRGVRLVVAQKDVLQARLVAGERHDGIARRRLDHRIRGSLHGEGEGTPFIQRGHLNHAVQRLERFGWNRVGERDRHLVALDGLYFGDVPDAHQAPIADDADRRAGFFDFAEDVRRQKDGAPFIARLEDQAIEFLLVEWIEAARRLVENQQTRAMHEGLDQNDLALVSGRVLAELAAGVELEAIDKLLEVRVIDTPAQVPKVLEDLPARQIGVERGLTGHVADEALDLQRLLPAVETRDPRGAGIGAQQGHQQSDRRRLAGTVRAQEAEHLALLDLERDVRDAALAAVVLGEFLRLDDCCHESPYQPNQKCSVASSVSVSDPFGTTRIRSNASVNEATDRRTTSKVMVPAWRAMKCSFASS